MLMSKIIKSLKEIEGQLGLTENSAGPEVSHTVQEFESNSPFNKDVSSETKHHSQNKSFQDRFCRHVTSLVKVIVASDNPFLELSHDFINIDTKDIADSVVGETVKRIKSIGEEQYTRYQEDRLIKQLKPIDDTISRNTLPLFSYKPQLKSKKKTEVAALCNNVKLFSQLYIANQGRKGDIDKFFLHENTAVPTSLAKDGKLHSGNKADLLGCLEDLSISMCDKPTVMGCTGCCFSELVQT